MDNTLIAYKSLGGNCDRIIKKLGIEGFKIDGDNIYDFIHGCWPRKRFVWMESRK